MYYNRKEINMVEDKYEKYDKTLRIVMLRKILDYVKVFGNINIDTLLYYYKFIDKKKEYLYENPTYVQNTFIRKVGMINDTVQYSTGLETLYKHIFNKDGMMVFHIDTIGMEKFRKERARNKSGCLVQ